MLNEYEYLLSKVQILSCTIEMFIKVQIKTKLKKKIIFKFVGKDSKNTRKTGIILNCSNGSKK